MTFVSGDVVWNVCQGLECVMCVKDCSVACVSGDVVWHVCQRL